jgi:hypothetical protein
MDSHSRQNPAYRSTPKVHHVKCRFIYMKTCSKCKQVKTIEEFPYRNKSKGTRVSWCKPCKQEYESEHYRKSDSRKLQIRSQNKVQRERCIALALAAKSSGCVDCGEKDPIVLDFDHLGDKIKNVAEMMNGTPHKMLAEIAKCEVVCANCHRRRTHSRRLAGVV